MTNTSQREEIAGERWNTKENKTGMQGNPGVVQRALIKHHALGMYIHQNTKMIDKNNKIRHITTWILHAIFFKIVSHHYFILSL